MTHDADRAFDEVMDELAAENPGEDLSLAREAARRMQRRWRGDDDRGSLLTGQ